MLGTRCEVAKCKASSAKRGKIKARKREAFKMTDLLKLFSGGGGISTALYGVIVSLILALVLVGWLYKGALGEIASLEASLQIARENTTTLKVAIDKQNNAIKALEVKATQVNTSAVDRIIIKDSSCEAELQGYKALFKELGKTKPP
ncbi:hypothetical protein [uncultured Helicobacter sp.]|uniref:hypothetical protein n=1 Tax=uncultured Helicobacter sp. TaxID=175537 RepID=UPI00260481A8|nr:hypothetical protein [uncultured Helicobacter sp.]